MTKVVENNTMVLLLDYGKIIEASTKSLIKYAAKDISSNPLSYSVSMNKILPTDTQNFTFSKSGFSNSDINIRLTTDNQWPTETIEYIKNLIACSKNVFFAIEVEDKQRDRLFGEFYLVIDDQNVCLRKLLIHRFKAILMTKEISEALKKGIVISPYKLKIEQKNLSLAKKKLTSDESLKDRIMINSVETCRRLNSIADSGFEAGVQKSLNKNGIYNLRTIQSYMWPAINQGLNVVTINPKESGKSIGYITPIASHLSYIQNEILEREKDQLITRPMVLILCHTIDKATKIFDKFRMILRLHKNIRVASMYNGQGDARIMTHIYNKPFILISTPPFLLRFMEKYPKKIDLSRLGYLVLDQADIILEKYEKEFYTIIKNNGVLNAERQYTLNEKKLQIITSGTMWSQNLKFFVEKFVVNPYICIGKKIFKSKPFGHQIISFRKFFIIQW